MIKTQEDFLEKYLPLTLLQGFEKGYSRFPCERQLKTEHKWNILTPTLWSVTLCLSRAPLDPSSIRAPESPFGRVWLSLPHLVSNWHSNSTVFLFNSSALYYLQTPTRWYGHASTLPQFLPISGDRDVSLPLSLEWPVWSSSSGNNCHAVQRFSCGASVYESIMGFFFATSHFISQFPPTRFPLITAIRMHHLEWHFWPGQKVKT